MKIVNRKTRKAIRKSVKKIVKKHGSKIAAGLAGGIASALAALASTDAAGTGGAQSNLGKVSERLTDAIGGRKKKARRRSTSELKLEKKGKRGKNELADTEVVDRPS